MSFGIWQRTITDDAGNVLPSAQIEVRVPSSNFTGALVSLFTDSTGATGKSNPFNADAEGFAEFYAANQKVDIRATSGGSQRTWRNVEIFGTAATADTDDLSIKQASNITVTVGASGDFATINEALKHLSGLYPEYKNTGVTATVELQTGFVMEEQVLVRGMDMGWITITGVDAETVIDHTNLTIDFTTADYGFDSLPAFGVSKGGTSPRIAQLFNMSSGSTTSEQKHGVLAVGAGSGAEIDSGCGVKNAGTNGIYATRGSTINADGADASGAGDYSIFANDAGTINARNANASNAGTNGIYALHASIINAKDADASGAGNHGIYAFRASTINAGGANASGAGNFGIFAAQGSTINAYTALIQNQTTGSYAIRILDGSHIEASGIDTTGTTVTILNQSENTLTSSGIIYQ